MIWLLFLCGLAILLYVLFNFYVGYGSKYWPVAQGRVLSSGVLTKTNTTISRNNKHHHPFVRYEYEVNNKNYQSRVLGTFVGFGNDKGYAESLIKDFHEQSEVKVFYCPFYAGISVLLPGMKQLAAHYILLFAGAIILLGTIPVLFSDNHYWFVDKIWWLVDIVT